MGDLLGGGTTVGALSGGYTPVVLFSGDAGTGLDALVTARAPITGLHVSESVSASVSMALNNDALVCTFGLSPVSIDIDGLEVYSCPGAGGDADDVAGFFARFNVFASKTARIVATIGTAVYTCVLLEYSREDDGTASGRGAGVSKWKLRLQGVRGPS